MCCYRMFLFSVYITYFLAVNGEHVTRENASHNHHHHRHHHHHHHHHKHHHQHLRFHPQKSQHHNQHHQKSQYDNHHHHHKHHHKHHHHHHKHHHQLHHQKSQHHNQHHHHQPLTTFDSERLALVFPVIQEFKKKVTYDPLGITKTWKGKNICQDYKGFLCQIVPGYNQIAIAGVEFNNFNLFGPNLTLTEFLMGLPDIVLFHANSNNFTGSIPSQLNKLKYLYELDLSNNNFSGNFPYEALRESNIEFLDIRYNTFVGELPPEVFLLKLDCLLINNNNLVQKLPDNLGSTPVHYLSLANNKFNGGIPPSIGQANDTLFEVLFLNNNLTGCLPYQIGLLKNAYLFDVESNYLSGPIPHSFQCLKKMEVLNLARNKFYGVVPEAVCSLPNLLNFTLSYNYFTQVGPWCRELIENGVVDVTMNCISDLPNQRPSTDCDKFFSATHSCPNETLLTYVPCSKGYSEYVELENVELESVGIQFIHSKTKTRRVLAPRPGIYGALFPDYVLDTPAL